MTKGLRVLLGVLIVCGLAVLVTSGSYAQPAVSSEQLVVTGEFVSGSVNGDEVSVVVKYLADEKAGTYQTASFYIEDTTKISKGEEAVSLSELKGGDIVTVNYTVSDSKNIASSVVVENNE